LELRNCPTTRPSRKAPAYGQRGDTIIQWGPLPEYSDGGQWYDSFAEGSYGFNEWCANPPASRAEFWNLDSNNCIRKLTTRYADNIPLVLDSVFVDTAVRDIDKPPSDAEHDSDAYRASWDTNAMKYYCIDRHSRGINAVFVDMHVQHVGIKQLWRFKWHKNFRTNLTIDYSSSDWLSSYTEY